MTSLLGLTGGLASGKTAAVEAFRRLGIFAVDADEIGRSLTAAGGAATDAVLRAIGGEFEAAGGGIDRAKLRRSAFADSGLRRKLERVLHPLIFARMAEELSAGGGAYRVACAPLLFESGMDGRMRFDAGILAIDCDEGLQLSRARARGMTQSEARGAMAAQLPRAERLSKATDVILNDKTLGDLESAVIDFDGALRARLAAGG